MILLTGLISSSSAATRVAEDYRQSAYELRNMDQRVQEIVNALGPDRLTNFQAEAHKGGGEMYRPKINAHPGECHKGAECHVSHFPSNSSYQSYRTRRIESDGGHAHRRNWYTPESYRFHLLIHLRQFSA